MTGYPDTCVDPALCTTSTQLYGFDEFASFPDTHRVGVVILDDPISLPEYGALAAPGFLDPLTTRRSLQGTTFTVSGYGVSRLAGAWLRAIVGSAWSDVEIVSR